MPCAMVETRDAPFEFVRIGSPNVLRRSRGGKIKKNEGKSDDEKTKPQVEKGKNDDSMLRS